MCKKKLPRHLPQLINYNESRPIDPESILVIWNAYQIEKSPIIHNLLKINNLRERFKESLLIKITLSARIMIP